MLLPSSATGRRSRRLRGALAVAFTAAALLAQNKPAPAADETPKFTSESRLVVLHASVIDKKGRLLTDLPQSAFKIFENGAEQNIKVFRREDVPVSLGMVIDNSGSMREKRGRVEQASLDLVRASNPQDEDFIVNFNDEAYLDVEFTNEIRQLEQGISRIDSRGGTALRDSISMSIDYLKSKGKKDKKVLLVITDGNDTASNDRDTLEKLVTKAQKSEVLIFAIGLLNEEERREAKKAKRVLDSLTGATGGLAYYPKEVADVHEIAQRVAHEIRNQYILAYTPTNQELDGTFRQIRVMVNGPGHPLVRTRTGYYATPQGAKDTTKAASALPPQR